jgi:hypothetical protein
VQLIALVCVIFSFSSSHSIIPTITTTALWDEGARLLPWAANCLPIHQPVGRVFFDPDLLPHSLLALSFDPQ